MNTPKPIKTLIGYTAHARFLHTLDKGSDGIFAVVRTIPRPVNIHSHNSYSPEWNVYRWNGREVLIVATAHRRYDVFNVADAIPSPETVATWKACQETR
jgi:hypothetical protein